jgi:hypothetical protein
MVLTIINIVIEEEKFPVGSNFFDNWHTYATYFSNFEVKIQVDGVTKGYATRYYEGPYHSGIIGSCHYHADAGIPSSVYSCSDVNALQECNVRVGNYCLVWNRFDKDLSFINYNTFTIRFGSAIIDKKWEGGVNTENQLYNS